MAKGDTFIVTSTVFVGRTALDRPRPHEPLFVLNDAAGVALHESSSHHLVTAILPWGTDAVFNRFQVPTLLGEVRDVASRQRDEEVSRHLHDLAAFIQQRSEEVGDFYVSFVSD